MSDRLKAALALALVVLATGPGQASAENSQSPPSRSVGARPEIIRPDADEGLQWAAGVVEITELRHQGDLTAKLFGTAGGDPAMNGLYTYLAFFESPAEGWRVFRLGDFLTYHILSETPGRVVVEIRENTNQGVDNMGTRTRRLLVSWRAGAGGQPPTTISVTTAR